MIDTAADTASPEAVEERRGGRLRGVSLESLVPLVVAVLVGVLIEVGNVLAPGFAGKDNLLNLMSLAAFLGIAGLGQTFVILTGGIDLSIAWLITGAAVVFTGVTNGSNGRLALGLVAALGLGLAAGILNGFGVAFVGLSPIVMTLGMNSVAQGVAMLYTNGTPKGAAPSAISDLATSWVHSVPEILIFWAILAVAAIAALRLTSGGRYLYAFGSNRVVSHLSGVSASAVIVAAYALSGLFAALTGVLLAGYSGTSFLGMGDAYLLPSIAAVVLGGTAILGGRGGYGGTVIGASFLTVLGAVLTIENLSAGIRDILYGLVIVAAVIFTSSARARR